MVRGTIKTTKTINMKHWKYKVIRYAENFIMVVIILIILLWLFDEQILKGIIKSYNKR
jgi:hypothetical protein